MENYLDILILLIALLSAILVVNTKNLLSAIITGSIFSLFCALSYLVMSAPDVALTEAAVGACASTCILLSALRLFEEDSKKSERSNILYAIPCICLFIVLSHFISSVHAFGDINAITNNGAVEYYIQKSGEDIGLLSIVNSILASYRGFDTFIETLVIFAAGMCVMMILNSDSNDSNDSTAVNNTLSNYPQSFAEDTRNRSVTDNLYLSGAIDNNILSVVARLAAPLIIAFGFYIQINGSNAPGGGFQAGAIMASAFILLGIVCGNKHILSLIGLPLFKNIAIFGVFIYGFIGMMCVMLGAEFLNYNILSAIPQSGQKLGILIIEWGVGITVFSVFCLIYFSFSAFTMVTVLEDNTETKLK